MSSLEAINSKCYDIFNFRYGNYLGFYEFLLYESERERTNALKQEVDLYLIDNLENPILYQENKNIYYVQLYIIHFLEHYLTHDKFLQLTNIVLSSERKQTNFHSPLLLLLMSDGCFSEDIIRKIYAQCEMELLKKNPKLGKKPYDYRYHLLKREETSEDIKNKILTSYDELTEEELFEFMHDILNELNYELCNHKIKNMDEVTKFPDLKKEVHFFEIMKRYYNDRLKKKKVV